MTETGVVVAGTGGSATLDVVVEGSTIISEVAGDVSDNTDCTNVVDVVDSMTLGEVVVVVVVVVLRRAAPRPESGAMDEDGAGEVVERTCDVALGVADIEVDVVVVATLTVVVGATGVADRPRDMAPVPAEFRARI